MHYIFPKTKNISIVSKILFENHSCIEFNVEKNINKTNKHITHLSKNVHHRCNSPVFLRHITDKQ